MRKFILPAIVIMVLICVSLFPAISFTEDKDAIDLARVIYALSRNESYDVKLAVGCIVMNRVESKWFGSTISEVLDDPQQFPAGERYNEECLNAAHDVISGVRNLQSSLLYYHTSGSKSDASKNISGSVEMGSYRFCSSDALTTVTGLL